MPTPNIDTPIIGYNGKIKTGAAATALEIDWAGEWEVSGKNDITTFGPFIGDGGKKYPVATGLLYSISIKGTIKQGSDIAMRAFKYAQANGTAAPPIELSAIGGDFWYFAAPVIEEFKSSLKGSGTHEFECKLQATLTAIGENPV